MVMIIMMIMEVLMTHNNFKERFDGRMLCHKTKSEMEKTKRMRVMNMVMMMMMMMMMTMAMMTMKTAITTMVIRLCVKMDDWRFYSVQKVDELQRSS